MIYVVGPNPTSLSFFKLKLLEKSVAQYGIKASFSDKSYVRISLPYIYIPHLLSPKEVDCGCLPIGLCVSPRAGIRVAREGEC